VFSILRILIFEELREARQSNEFQMSKREISIELHNHRGKISLGADLEYMEKMICGKLTWLK